MPVYPYCCKQCNGLYYVTKPLAHIDNVEYCSFCGSRTERTIALSNFTNAGDWKPEFNPALGCVVRSKAHQREILSRMKGEGKEIVEIGNEPLDKIHHSCDSLREQKQVKRWSEPTDKVLQEGLK